MRLLLIRHGETPSNVEGALDTARPGAPLTALGHRQAEAIPGALAGEPIAAVHASPLVRTQLTAAPLVASLGVAPVVTEGLEEIEAGDLEMRTDAAAIDAYADAVAAWIGGDLDARMPGGSDGRAFFARYDAAIAALAAGHPDTAMLAAVSHGAAIRAFAARHGGPSERRLQNTGAVLLDGSPSAGWTVLDFRTEPLGGAHLADPAAVDPTGDPDPV